jgi:hypothetical protein
MPRPIPHALSPSGLEIGNAAPTRFFDFQMKLYNPSGTYQFPESTNVWSIDLLPIFRLPKLAICLISAAIDFVGVRAHPHRVVA